MPFGIKRHKDAVGWQALDYALSHVFNDEVKETIMEYFEMKQKLFLENKKPFTPNEIGSLLQELLGAGGSLVLTQFEKKLEELRALKASKTLHA